jgi:hypothetical protein
MGCLALEIIEPIVTTKFKCKKENQKYLIEFILTHGDSDLKSLSILLESSTRELSNVLIGVDYLTGASAVKLAKFFLIFFNE